MRKNWLPIFVPMIAVACATVPSSATFKISVDSYDDPSSESIRVSYKNETGRTVCLTPENWPNSFGKINQASNTVWLVVDGIRFELKNFNTGYCAACAKRVANEQVINSNIPYFEFGLPNELYRKKKVIYFQSYAFYCENMQ
jgi:hypothetical protein